MSLFYIQYGCSISTEHLIIDAKDEDAAIEYAYQSAQEVYYSYDCNYPSMEDCGEMNEDEIAEMMQQDMEYDLIYFAILYDPEAPDHEMTLREQHGTPY